MGEMPARVFKYNTLAELKENIKALSGALVGGNVEILKNSASGWLTQFTRRSPEDLRSAIMEMRTEIYLRGQDDAATDKGACQDLEPNDPRREKVMRVEHRHADSY